MAASAILWDAASAADASLHTTSLNTLASNTLSAASSNYDNSAAHKTAFWLELVTGTLGSAAVAGETVDVYAVKSLDGTNFDDAPVTGGVNYGNLWVCSFVYLAVTTARRQVKGPFPLDPMLYKFYVDNRLTGAFNATGNTLKIHAGSLESQ